MRMKKNNFREKVFEVVKNIPKGKVATYGQVALLLGKPRGAREVGWPFASAQGKMLFARAVGNALHMNNDPRVPCHRVVDRTGRLAPNFGGPSLWSFGRRAPSKSSLTRRSGAFDGMVEQRRRLENEGVKFIDKIHVDLEKHSWKSR